MNDNLLKKLEKMYERYTELERLLSNPEVIADSNRYTAYIKEHGCLSKMVNKYTQLTETRAKKQEAEGLLTQEGTDKEFVEMARDELGELEKQEDSIMEEIKGLFITDDKTYCKNVIAEIRAGTGGEEAAIFAANLFRMYTKYAENQGWKVELFDSSETDLGGFREVTFSIEGKNVYQNCVLKVERTVFRGFLRQKPAAGFTHQQPRWLFCRKLKRWKLISIQTTS